MRKERYGSDDRVDARETVGNSLGRALLGRSEVEATTGWTPGKPWEIAWGELCWEGARWKRRQGGRSRQGWTEGKPWEIAWGEFCWEGARWK